MTAPKVHAISLTHIPPQSCSVDGFPRLQEAIADGQNRYCGQLSFLFVVLAIFEPVNFMNRQSVSH